MSWIAALKTALHAFAAFFGWLDRKQTRDGAKAEVVAETQEKTIETINTVNAPIAESDRERVRKSYRRD